MHEGGGSQTVTLTRWVVPSFLPMHARTTSLLREPELRGNSRMLLASGGAPHSGSWMGAPPARSSSSPGGDFRAFVKKGSLAVRRAHQVGQGALAARDEPPRHRRHAEDSLAMQPVSVVLSRSSQKIDQARCERPRSRPRSLRGPCRVPSGTIHSGFAEEETGVAVQLSERAHHWRQRTNGTTDFSDCAV